MKDFLICSLKIRRRRNRKVHKLGNQEIWSGFLTQSGWQWNITLTSVVLKFSSVIQIFGSLALYAIGRVSCAFRKRSFHPIQFVSHEKCFHRISTRFSAITSITYIFSWKMYSKPLKDIQNKR